MAPDLANKRRFCGPYRGRSWIIELCLLFLAPHPLVLKLRAATITTEQSDAAKSASTMNEICPDVHSWPQQLSHGDKPRTRDRVISERHIEKPIWWNYSIDDLFTLYFNCGQILYGYSFQDPPFRDSGEIANDDEWHEYEQDGEYKATNEEKNNFSSAVAMELRRHFTVLRDKYREEVGLVPMKNVDVDVVGSKTTSATVMKVPVRVGDAGPKKGRGIFATESISKGQLVLSLENDNVAIFKTGHSWRKFVATLPRETACNFIEWSWVQHVPPRNHCDNDIRNGLTIFAVFDESSLMNNAEWGHEEANIRCGSPPEDFKSATIESKLSYDDSKDWGPCRFDYYATRDISSGEELLINYSEFEDVSQVGWKDIGL